MFAPFVLALTPSNRRYVRSLVRQEEIFKCKREREGEGAVVTAKRAAKPSEPVSDWAAGGLELRPNSTRQFHGANHANAISFAV